MKRFLAKINDFTKDYTHEPVPEGERCHGWHIFMIWVVSLICLPAMMLGFSLADGLNFKTLIVAILLGQFLLAIFMCFSAYIGGKLHLPSSKLLETSFGYSGVKFVSIFTAIAVLGWYGFQLELFAVALQTILSQDLGLDIHKAFLIIPFGLLMSITSVIGFKALDLFSRISGPLLVIVLFIPIFKIWPELDWNALVGAEPVNPVPFGVAIGMILGSVSLGMLVSPDYTRYAYNEKHAVWGMFASAFVASSLFVFYAAFVMLATGERDFIKLLYDYGLGWPALLVIILTTWTTNDTNNYIAGIALTAIFTKARKWVLCLICAVFGTLAALIGVAANFVPWLMLLSVTFAPAAAAYVTDYFFQKDKYENHYDHVPRSMRWETLISWLSGVFVGLATMPKANLGFELFSLSGISAVDGLVCTVLVHSAFMIYKRPKA